MNLPVARSVAAQPLERAGVFGVGRPPAGPEGEVDPAVAVDVVRLDADVVARGRLPDDVMLAPARVLVPDDGVLGHGHDVGLLVAVDVGHGDRVADVADVRVDFLRLKLGQIRPRASTAIGKPTWMMTQ